MKKNAIIEIICSLIVIVLVVLGFNLYTRYIDFINLNSNLIATYELDISDFSYVNSTVSGNNIYILYNKNDYYLVKNININNDKENIYSYSIDGSCKLQNESDYPYIYCTDNNTITIYDTEFKKIINQNIASNYNYSLNINGESLNFKIIDNTNSYEYINGYYLQTNNEYVSLDTPYVKDAYCANECLIVRYNNLTELMSLYKEDDLLETNIVAYHKYENGFYTYNNKEIKIYNANSTSHKEFDSPVSELLSTVFTVGANDYYIYVVNGSKVDVYNLYDSEFLTSISINNVKEDIKEIVVNDNYLYLYGDSTLYVYDIKNIENNTKSYNSYETDLITNIIEYYQNAYNVTINLEDDPSDLSSNYNVTLLYNYNDIVEAIDALSDYFKVFNKTFFSRFTNYGKGGIEIYLVDSISSNSQNSASNASVVGLYTNKNNKYNIIISVSDIDEVVAIAFHETMHAIEDYLTSLGVSFSSWNNLNPSGFTYPNVYYTNQLFTDTMSGSKYYSNVYFVDNYARSSEYEDRARMFEYLCMGEYFSEYPYLNNKINYLKKIVLSNFPELASSSYFL